jgi:hypothetical protein
MTPERMATLHAHRRRNDLYVIYDPAVRCHVPVSEAEELATPGESVVRLFWCPQAQKHITVPGASLYTIQPDGTYVLTHD